MGSRPLKLPYQGQRNHAYPNAAETDASKKQGKEVDWLASAHELASGFVEQHERHHAESQSDSKTNKKIAVGAIAVAAISALLSCATLIVVTSQTGAAWKAVGDSEVAIGETHRQTDAAYAQLSTMREASRPWLKITGITNISATRAPNGIVAWFNFKPLYKNFGPIPAQSISFISHIFVVGEGPSPEKTCEADGVLSEGRSEKIIFPQEEVADDIIRFQVPIRDIEKEAAEVRSIQPDGTIYLGVIGCLIYKSARRDAAYITGFVGDLHPEDIGRSKSEAYVPIYNTVVESNRSVEVRIKITTLDAWAE